MQWLEKFPEGYERVIRYILEKNEEFFDLPEIIREALDRYFIALIEPRKLIEILKKFSNDIKIFAKISEEFGDILGEFSLMDRRFLLENPEKCYKLLKLITKSNLKEYYMNKILFCMLELEKMSRGEKTLMTFNILDDDEKDYLLAKIWAKVSLDVSIDKVIEFVNECDVTLLRIISEGNEDIISEIIRNKKAKEVIKKVWEEIKSNKLILLSDIVKLSIEDFRYFVETFEEYKEKFERYGVSPAILDLIEMGKL